LGSDDILENSPYIETIEEEIRARIKSAKMRILPGGPQQCLSYNSQVTPEIIPDHNDPHKIEWTEENEEHDGIRNSYFVGQKVKQKRNYEDQVFDIKN